MVAHVGDRVRRWRIRRGLSQREFAGLAGVTQGFVSQVENGIQSVDRRSTLVAFAQALQITVADLLGDADPADPNKQQAAKSVPAIRVAIAELEAGDSASRHSRTDVLVAIQVADQFRVACDYAHLGPLLPDLLRQATGLDPSTRSEVLHLTATFLRSIGFRDLAWRASDLALVAARETDDLALLGAVQFKRLLCMPPEAAGVITNEARRTYELLQSHAADAAVRRGYGMLHLLTAFVQASTSAGDNIQAHIGEAWTAASSLGEPPSPGGLTMSFGPTNAGLWEMAVALELGEYQRVVEIAKRIDPEQAEHANRRSMYWLDLGRALAHLRGRDREAIMAFAQAERAAPQYVRALPAARDAVTALIGRARQRAVADDLRRLAGRMGLLSADTARSSFAD